MISWDIQCQFFEKKNNRKEIKSDWLTKVNIIVYRSDQFSLAHTSYSSKVLENERRLMYMLWLLHILKVDSTLSTFKLFDINSSPSQEVEIDAGTPITVFRDSIESDKCSFLFDTSSINSMVFNLLCYSQTLDWIGRVCQG